MNVLSELHWIWFVWAGMLVAFLVMAWWGANYDPRHRNRPKH